MGRLRQALDVVAITVTQCQLDFLSLKVVAQRFCLWLVTVQQDASALIYNRHAKTLYAVSRHIVVKQSAVGQTVLA